MKLYIALASIILADCGRSQSGALAVATISTQVQLHDVVPFGVNLGSWTSWGADQLASNIVKNPGFEGMIDRAIIIVHTPSGHGFHDSERYLARADHFWDGARYEILTGQSAGVSGEIVSSLARAADGLPYFESSSDTSKLQEGDVVSITRTSDREEPANWWFTKRTGLRYEPAEEVRPGSGGRRSLRIESAGLPAQAISYFDAIGDRAGKLLPLCGAWRLSCWSRLEAGNARLQVVFKRDGSPNILARNVLVSAAWHRTDIDFEGTDDGPPGIVSLNFEVVGNPHGAILFDDVDLRRTSDTKAPFRHEVSNVLTKLQPAYLRDWQGQLGDTAVNRTASSDARRTTRYRPGDASQSDYGYSLPEFLELALQVKASPWIVVPTTFSLAECASTGEFLRADRRYRSFREVLVEFGNENWNSIFRPAGISVSAAHAEAAQRCLQAVEEHARPLPLRMVVNAQHANLQSAEALSRSLARGTILAVAPYFLHSLNAGEPTDQAASRLFDGDDGRMQYLAAAVRDQRQELAIYEVGPHTNEGTANDDERVRITSGLPSATALAVTMLDALSIGTRRQCVYSLSGFDNRTSDGKGFVRLWGITRDLGPTLRLRPTGLSLQLMNRALQGDMLQVKSTDPEIHVYAFRQREKWSAIVASSSQKPKTVSLRFPTEATLPQAFIQLQSDFPGSTNEDGLHVSAVESKPAYAGQTIAIHLGSFGLAALVSAERSS